MKSKQIALSMVLITLVGAASVWGAEPASSHKKAISVPDRKLPPVRAVTDGPKFHWFGYYDKFQFDPTDRYLLGMEVDFEGRSPRPEDVIKIGMIDLHEGDRWTELGESRAWCWQQGCMLQWRPGSKTEVMWNDRQGNRFVCHILDVFTGRKRTIPHPIYTVSSDGRTAVAPDFCRVNDVRPGYGYAGLPDPYANDSAPKDSGIFQVDLETGRQKLIISIAKVAQFGRIPGNPKGVKHYFNHLLFSPDGSRFIFLHRWRFPNGRRLTRLLTAAPGGSDLRVIDDNGFTSHFIWRDPKHIMIESQQPTQGRGFYLFEDRVGKKVEHIGKGVVTAGGHCLYLPLPGREWCLFDTYPDKQRNQNVYLYHVPTNRKIFIGHFYSPKDYRGEWRVDTHPRFSRDGRSLVIDSAHEGKGRQMYLIDISGIVVEGK